MVPAELPPPRSLVPLFGCLVALSAFLALPALQAYQDANGSPWPSSPWPRQQTAPQGATAPAGTNSSTPAASAASSGSGSSSGSSGGGDTAAAQQQQGQQQAAGWPHQRVRAYRGLSASQFQHPLDQQNTALLRALPGLELLARNMMVRCAGRAPWPATLSPVAVC